MSRLTRKEFDKRYAAYSRSMLVPSIVLLLGGLAVAIWLDKSEFSRQSIAASMIVIGVGLCAVWYLDSFTPKKFGLGCPACGKSIVRFLRFQKHIDKGRCPRCKEKIIDAGENGL